MSLEEASKMEVRSLRSILSYQFGYEAAKLIKGEVEVKRSRSTGRIREVYLDGILIGVIRAGDGFFVPSLEGAARLLRYLPPPRVRVIVPTDVAVYVARGRSVFCKHVLDAGPEIRPMDEVIVVDEDDNLVAVGKALLAGPAMKLFSHGRAVKVRKGTRKGRS